MKLVLPLFVCFNLPTKSNMPSHQQSSRFGKLKVPLLQGLDQPRVRSNGISCSAVNSSTAKILLSEESVPLKDFLRFSKVCEYYSQESVEHNGSHTQGLNPYVDLTKSIKPQILPLARHKRVHPWEIHEQSSASLNWCCTEQHCSLVSSPSFLS